MKTLRDITKNDKIKFTALVIALDFFTTVAPGVIIDQIYLGRAGNSIGVAPSLSVALICMVLLAVSGAYRPANIVNPLRFIEFRITILICLWTVILTVTVGLKQSGAISRVWLFSWAATSGSLNVIWAMLFSHFEKRTKIFLAIKPKAEIVFFQCDDGRPWQELARQKFPSHNVVNFSRIDGIADLARHIQFQRSGPETIALVCKPAALEDVLSSLYQFKLSGLEIFLIAAILSAQNSGAGAGAGPILLPAYCAIQRPMREWDIFTKRLIDIVLSVVLLLIAIPLILIAAICIYLEDGRPVLFRQPRVGYGNFHFNVWKFRTMYVKSADLGAERQTAKNDERVTCVGRILRATSLDELPQLFNVLVGTMSLVGPRPHALKMNVDSVPIAALIDTYGRRHCVRPGMTGLAQVRGFRGPAHDAAHMESRTKADIEYIENWSILRDFTILIKTIYLVLGDISGLVTQRKAGWR